MMTDFYKKSNSFLKYLLPMLCDHDKHTLNYYFIRKILIMSSSYDPTLVISQEKQVVF
jgi:hypothetical protein